MKKENIGVNDKVAVISKMLEGCDVSQEDYECSLENLSESLSHQLSFYSASYLAVPYLVKFFELKEKAGDFEEQLQLLLNIGAIFATDIDNSRNRGNIVVEEDLRDNFSLC